MYAQQVKKKKAVKCTATTRNSPEGKTMNNSGLMLSRRVRKRMSRQFKQNGLITMIFALVSLFASMIFMKSGVITGIASDAGFHFSRVEQIYDNLKNGSFFIFILSNLVFISMGFSALFFKSSYFFLLLEWNNDFCLFND
ncbi:hypothetical protein ACFSF7_05980 [Ligilactobacillus acidipiscis]|uniref:hypothetical protein n=1 Tax=Ligilactobacillus acidipiscis TaxID=89059 RepID=UPI000A26F822